MTLAVFASPWWLLGVPLIWGGQVLFMLPSIEAYRYGTGVFRFVFVIATFLVAYIIVGEDFRPEREFFAVSAQIIPVLILAFVFEARH